jgi:hydrogenase nickel incorporation protein HypA/HybF
MGLHIKPPMHELAITQEIIEIACEKARGARIKRLVIEVGKLSCVLPDTVRFWFEMCRENTPACTAALDIIETPGLGRCRTCGNELQMDSAFCQCICGSTDLDWLRGEELRIKEMEIF